MRSPFVTGLLHPANLLMLVLTVFAGLVAAWWLFPLGLVLWLVMVLVVSRDPTLRLSHRIQSRAPVAQRFQSYLDRTERAQITLYNSLASAPSNTARALEPVQTEVNALTARVYEVAQRMTVMENHRLVSESRRDLPAELQQINDAIDQSGDSLVKSKYEESRRVLLERIAKLKLISTELDLVEAQMLGLANELDGIVSETIRLQAVSPTEASRYVPGLVSQLRKHGAALGESERAAADVYEA
jgi:hypothetical protein